MDYGDSVGDFCSFDTDIVGIYAIDVRDCSVAGVWSMTSFDGSDRFAGSFYN